jgi:hypothetical protein
MGLAEILTLVDLIRDQSAEDSYGPIYHLDLLRLAARAPI